MPRDYNQDVSATTVFFSYMYVFMMEAHKHKVPSGDQKRVSGPLEWELSCEPLDMPARK